MIFQTEHEPTVMPKWVTHFLVLLNNGGHKDFIVLFPLHRNCCRQWLVLKFMFNVFSVLPLDIRTERSLQSALLANFNHEIHPDHPDLVAFVHYHANVHETKVSENQLISEYFFTSTFYWVDKHGIRQNTSTGINTSLNTITCLWWYEKP